MGGLLAMPKRLKYVLSYSDRHGKRRHYFRRHGKRVALPGAFGSGEFMAAYGAALAASADTPRPSQPKAKTGTFAALSVAYYGSPQYIGLAPTTRTTYRAIIERFLVEHGHRRVDQMRREHVDRVVGQMADRPGAALTMLKRLRTLCRYAMAIGWIDRDPTAGAKAWSSKEIHTWTEAEIDQYEAHWPIGSKQRLAFALHLYTGQRGSDVHRMTWPDVSGDAISVVQQKTGTKLSIALHADLQNVLVGTARDHVAIVTTEYGRPFSVKGFGQFMSAAIRAAGLPDRCKAHGLRKAAARRLAEAGCTAHEIAAVTGHKSLAEVERYTRAADQARLSRAAIEKQSANKSD